MVESVLFNGQLRPFRYVGVQALMTSANRDAGCREESGPIPGSVLAELGPSAGEDSRIELTVEDFSSAGRISRNVWAMGGYAIDFFPVDILPSLKEGDSYGATH